MFSDQVYHSVQNKTDHAFGKLIIEDVRIGAFLSAVKLSSGYFGVAGDVQGNEVHQCGKKQRNKGDFSPLQIIGKSMESLFGHRQNNALIRSLKIASLNAFFQQMLHQNKYPFLSQTDPADLLDFTRFSNIVMVGAFNAYIEKISAIQPNLRVLELSEAALLPEYSSFYVPADRFAAIIPQADLVIITGHTLVNDTFDDLVACIAPQSTAVLVGPSAGIPPELLFENHLSMIGAAMITRPEKLFSLVGQGASGYHLFQYCAEKITLVHE